MKWWTVLFLAVATTRPATQVQWLTSLNDGYARQQRDNLPMLVVVGDARAVDSVDGALSADLANRLVLVRLDPAESREAMRFLGVAKAPAVRVLAADGHLIAARDDLAVKGWLSKALAPAVPPASTPSQFIADLSAIDPAIRQWAIAQLSADRDVAPRIVSLLDDPTLRTRTAALALLQRWNAPVQGIDPWTKSTLTPARLGQLRTWAQSTPGANSARPVDLSQAGVLLDAMLAAPTDPDARAMRPALVDFGPALLPMVDARLAAARGDTTRQRLLALRYRLAATDRLATAWPDGFDRLASSDPFVRRAAVSELGDVAQGTDWGLLIELFSDDDPFVRETALHILGQLHVPQTDQALLRLLRDPQPNVRAAVLATFWEEVTGQGSSDPAALVAGLSAYVRQEKNSDLVVQCIRLLEKIPGDDSIDTIAAFLIHPQWRVRAEAADAIAQKVLSGEKFDAGRTAALIADLTARLSDSDGFVASQSAIALVRFDDDTANQAILKALDRRPSMAIDLLGLVRLDEQLGTMLLPTVRKFITDREPRLRITAIDMVCRLDPNNAQDVIGPGMADADLEVRQAALSGLASAIDSMIPTDSMQAMPDGTSRHVDMAAWTAAFISGPGRPAWMSPLKAKLLPFLAVADPQTRVNAAVCLCALGDGNRAWPVIEKMASSELTRDAASMALPWLPWQERKTLFDRLLAITPDGQMDDLTSRFVLVPERRAAPLLWALLTDPNREQILSPVAEALISAYGIQQNGSNASADSLQTFAHDAAAILKHGGELQKVTALYIYYQCDSDGAAQPAMSVFHDPTSSAALRNDALNIFLFTAPKEVAEPLAAKSIADPALRKTAIQFLCDTQWVSLRGQFDLYNRQEYEMPAASIIPVHIPAGLNARLLMPELASGDSDDAGRAGYLLCLLGDRRGLAPLLAAARRNGWDQDEWRQMAYKAITRLDDDSQTPVLDEIYKSFNRSNDTWQIRTFYWTIRAMHGPNILKLRKQIRDDVGTVNLVSEIPIPENQS